MIKWSKVDRNTFLHPVDVLETIGGPKATNTKYRTREEIQKKDHARAKKITAKQLEALRIRQQENIRPVIQKRLNGEVVNRFESAGLAAGVLGLTVSGIRAVCNGKKASYAGCIWEYEK